MTTCCLLTLKGLYARRFVSSPKDVGVILEGSRVQGFQGSSEMLKAFIWFQV